MVACSARPRHARDCNWTLVHSRDEDILSTIHQGKMFLSRLEGEWWMRFLEE